MKYKAIIFDCDGTLLDTIKDLTNAVNYALEKFGFALKTEEETLKMVGNGIKMLVKRALPEEVEQNVFDEVFACFKAYYNEHYADFTAPYSGITETLKILKKQGYRLALVSNKQRDYLAKLYDMFFKDTIEYAIGETEGYAPKPAPDMVNLALSKLGVKKEDAVYVGDSSVDIATARNSEMDGIFVSWGFNTKRQLKENGAKIIIDAPLDLVGLV